MGFGYTRGSHVSTTSGQMHHHKGACWWAPLTASEKCCPDRHHSRVERTNHMLTISSRFPWFSLDIRAVVCEVTLKAPTVAGVARCVLDAHMCAVRSRAQRTAQRCNANMLTGEIQYLHKRTVPRAMTAVRRSSISSRDRRTRGKRRHPALYLHCNP